MMRDPHETDSRTQLVQRALREHEPALIAYALSLVGDEHLARDVVQETMIRLCAQPAGTVDAALKAWLFTVCRNKACDVLRRRRRWVSVDDSVLERTPAEGPSPGEGADGHALMEEVLRYVARLPQNQQEVVRLKFQAGLSYAEISEVTGLTESNIGFLLHTALRRLRSVMAHRKEALLA